MGNQCPEIEAKMKKNVYGGIVILGILFLAVVAGMTWKFFIPTLTEKEEIIVNPY